MLSGLRKRYVNFIEKDKRSVPENIFYGFLCFLSWVYGGAVSLRNFFYDKRIIPVYASKAKVVSVGNLSWAGTGKTSLSLWLYEQFSSRHKVAILRRGYGDDEAKLLAERCPHVFSAPDRRKLAKENDSGFDCFILDDGFQYRRLKKDVNIVVMGAREFRKKYRLIPAYFFREPLSSLRRADILILNYSEEMKNPSSIESSIAAKIPGIKVYFSRYHVTQITDMADKPVEINSLKEKKLAAFAAIGYPQGFFNKLKEVDLNIVKKITYPDHYELSEREFAALQSSLIENGIRDLIITRKDRYHLPSGKSKINIYILDVAIEVSGKDAFLKQVILKLGNINQ